VGAFEQQYDMNPTFMTLLGEWSRSRSSSGSPSRVHLAAALLSAIGNASSRERCAETSAADRQRAGEPGAGAGFKVNNDELKAARSKGQQTLIQQATSAPTS
jgi:hypothetical protein